ncbi:YeeE/YedE family protein [Oceaniglobus roseus]|uniref:YeeE/YedE family protein n=1 Tax=Oceaniglobus roseus TaxID=1737570 RepID=UPI000C7F2F1C|nr:YeeE/YedE family protein [Kandeliimicrobium roseum]
MLFEMFDALPDPRLAQLLFGLAIGALFGVAAQVSRFCLRRAVAGDEAERGSAGAVWLTALAVAVAAFAGAAAFGWVDLAGHRYVTADVPVLAIVLGGLAFGVGMVLTRGCVSRLSVLGATGNLRALTVVLLFAVVAHATLKGVLSPLRTALGAHTVEMPFGTFAALPGAVPVAVVALLAVAAFLVRRFRPAPLHVVMGALIGLVPVLGWAATSVLLQDGFEPLEVQSAAFTLPWTDTLFWIIASTAIPAGFGTGFIGGVLGGAFLSAALRGELAWQSFESPGQTLRYGAGAVLMGVGGVLAGGCTVGAGLSGVSTLGVSAVLALVSIVSGGIAAGQVLGWRARGHYA